MKTIRVSEKFCPWINNDLEGMIRSREKLKKAAVKSGFPLLWASYRHVRNKVNRLNIDLKWQRFTAKIQSSEGNINRGAHSNFIWGVSPWFGPTKFFLDRLNVYGLFVLIGNFDTSNGD